MSSIHKIDVTALDVENNVYWQNDANMFNRLLEIVNNSKSYIRSIGCTGAHGHSRDNRDLLRWIMRQTAFLGDIYELKTRCYWILYGLVDFPKCWNYDNCRNNMANKNIKTIWTGYGTCCCSEQCSVKRRVLLTRQNLYEKYGVVNVFQLQDVKNKCKDSHIKKLGVENPSQSEKIKQKKIKTCFAHYGVEHPLQSKDIQKRFAQTCMDRFGCEQPGRSEIVKRRIVETNQAKRGVDYVFQDNEVKSKIKETLMDRYGVDCILKSPAILEKTREFYRKNYGVDYGLQVPEIRRKGQRRYLYDGINFDSAPELAYYIWLTDSGIRFEFQSGDFFEYEFNSVRHRYFPDFKVFENGGFFYVEIKGDHFLAEDGTWRNPYRNPSWSDEQYQVECAGYEAKRQCAIANGVRILYSDSYIRYLNYVSEKYGAKYIDSFRKASCEPPAGA